MLSCLYHSLIEQHSLDQGERICAAWGLIKRNGRETIISENKDGDHVAMKKVILYFSLSIPIMSSLTTCIA